MIEPGALSKVLLTHLHELSPHKQMGFTHKGSHIKVL